MGARFGFSPVPRWRSKGVLGVALAAALIAETFVATTDALAAPTPAETSADEQAPRGPDGELQAPDIATGKTIARLEGERVEVVGERTTSSSTWALPDGKLVTGHATGPIWVRGGGDGTTAADWAPVDLTLEVGEDGKVRPKAHPADLVLAGEGAPDDGALVTMESPEAESVGLAWTDELPAPRLEGPRAVYPEVEEGVDLVVEATRTGYEQFYVLTSRPEPGEAPELDLTVIGTGLEAERTADGGVEFTTPDGELVGTSGTPMAWDADVDAERLHAVTEPWTESDGELSSGLSPMPAWTEPGGQDAPPGTDAPPVSDLGTDMPLPADADLAPREEAGRSESPEAAAAGGSSALPLTQAATVTALGVVEMSLTPDPDFLADPDTQFPVVVDPEYQWFGWFDTWVQTGIGTDKSGDPELRLGTWDGGSTVARSYLNLDLGHLKHRQIFGASLNLWNWHSAPHGCNTANAWQVMATDPAGTGTRISAEPAWRGVWSVSYETKGGQNCSDGWVGADITDLVQYWSNAGASGLGLGLKAAYEWDSNSWKKFNSGNAAGNLPTLWVAWNTAPGPATGLNVQPSATDSGVLYSTSATPKLWATPQDVDGDITTLTFQVYITNSSTKVFEGTAANVHAGQSGYVTLPAGTLQSGTQYTYRVFTSDGLLTNTTSGWSPYFTVDTVKPAAPSVSSPEYKSDGSWNTQVAQLGHFTFSLPAADATLSGFMWGLNKTPDTKVASPNSVSATLDMTPAVPGRNVLQVHSIDKAGHPSATVNYVFYVGRAALTSPQEGAQVVRRVRLTVKAQPEFTHIKYVWRRGPDAETTADIPLGNLSAADGGQLSTAWTKLTDLGDYATWDAGTTLGAISGPAQVQALLATDSSGGGAYATPWVSLVVSPDAQYAATDTIGPGSVNLLTGDYRLSSTDVDEFGLSIGRTASSRDPKEGYEAQRELLSTEQRTVSSVAGYAGSTATVSRVTNRGHTGMDALKVVPNSSNTDSYAYPGALNVGDIGLKAGRTYRVSAWIYVPSATGLPDPPSKVASIQGFYRDPATGAWTGGTPARATQRDTWQQLTVDLSIPAGSWGVPHLRLYNGYGTSDKAVFFDDVSVTEVWAPFGPQWSLGTADQVTGTAYSHISQPYPDVAALHLAEGGEIWFTSSGNEIWWPQSGAESLTLKKLDTTRWTLSELDGTVSEFARQGATPAELATAVDFPLISTSPPATAGQTRLVYEGVGGRMRLGRMIAPVEPGVDPGSAAPCTVAPYKVGCEVLELVYASTTTAVGETLGDYADQVTEVRLHAAATVTDPTTSAVPAVRYRYDGSGRLREVWDPRVDPAQPTLVTRYTYDADGRVTSLTPPGELAWRFTYGTGGAGVAVGHGDVLDRSSGRLLRVSRDSLVPGSRDQTGPETTTTVVYAVPLTRTAGGPHNLDRDSTATWAQRSAPTDATAIFGPEDVPSVTTATSANPGMDGYRPATVHYLDSSGREVNTATPSGPDAPAGGFIDTAEYDQYGNLVRSLDATNRLLALGQLPSAAADLASLNLGAAGTTARAVALYSESTYGPEGIDLLRTRGPLVRLAVGNDPDNVQLVHDVSTYAYDEGKPDGVAYHLVTTQTDALLVAGSAPEQLVDAEVTENGYHPIDAPNDLQAAIGPTSGWKHGQPTKVTFDATGANLSALVRYDAQGRAVESRGIGALGSDARTNIAVYYTADASALRAECRNTPAYAGLPCMSFAAGDVQGHDPARMAGQLPVKHVTAYNRYGSIASVTESATGPVNGASVTQTRTTATVYDAADRVQSVTITTSGAGAGAAVAKTVNKYDATTGDVTVIQGQDPSGAVLSTVKKSFDLLGRMTRYEDGSGGWTTSTFDRFGKPTEVTDSTGSTTSFTYDRSTEPRGYVTSVTDSVGGTVSATYGPDGQVTEQSLPGGVGLRIGYDANRTPVSRTYVRMSDDAVISASAAVENSAGQMVTHTTPASSKRYSYDALGRLTGVQDTIGGAGLCVARAFGYDPRGNRSFLASAVSGTDACADPGNPGGAAVDTTAYTYDTADRLVTESTVAAGAWVYDPLGRITTAPVRGSPGATVVNGYYANDLIASQTIDGVARQTWQLDAIGRFASYTNQAWAVGGNGMPGWQEAVTKVSHYDSDSDSPAWIAEDTSLPDEITRYVDGLDGNLAMETGKTGARVLQLIDLHGDVMTTLPIRDGQNTADWTGLAHQAADEFGNPTDLTTGATRTSDGQSPGAEGRYGWLGGKQRSADALAGVILMGVRLYDPATGRFWSRDPSPGGNSTAYDYCSADPVNCTDLDGHAGWFTNLVKKAAKKVARVAEVVATVVPGPVGAAAGAISAGAYAVTGNRSKALEVGVIAAAALVGAGAAVKVGIAIGRKASASLAVRVATRINQAPIDRAEKAAAWLGSKNGGAQNLVGRWLGRQIKNPRNGAYFNPGGKLNSTGNRVGLSPKPKTGGKVLRPAIRIAIPGKKSSRQPHYYLD